VKTVLKLFFKSMNIKKEPKKVRDGKSYLPKGVDGVGSSTKKFLELAPEQMLPQADRRELEDNRLVMKVKSKENQNFNCIL